jgi:hypothetical protein
MIKQTELYLQSRMGAHSHEDNSTHVNKAKDALIGPKKFLEYQNEASMAGERNVKNRRPLNDPNKANKANDALIGYRQKLGVPNEICKAGENNVKTSGRSPLPAISLYNLNSDKQT